MSSGRAVSENEVYKEPTKEFSTYTRAIDADGGSMPAKLIIGMIPLARCMNLTQPRGAECLTMN
jgi:hypothetical protein